MFKSGQVLLRYTPGSLSGIGKNIPGGKKMGAGQCFFGYLGAYWYFVVIHFCVHFFTWHILYGK
jgi:hypothetical protein